MTSHASFFIWRAHSMDDIDQLQGMYDWFIAFGHLRHGGQLGHLAFGWHRTRFFPGCKQSVAFDFVLVQIWLESRIASMHSGLALYKCILALSDRMFK